MSGDQSDTTVIIRVSAAKSNSGRGGNYRAIHNPNLVVLNAQRGVTLESFSGHMTVCANVVLLLAAHGNSTKRHGCDGQNG